MEENIFRIKHFLEAIHHELVNANETLSNIHDELKKFNDTVDAELTEGS